MRRSGHDGYILVAVLSVMLLLTGFLTAGSVLIRSVLRGASVADASLAMEGLTQGGLELAAYRLFVSRLSPSAVDGRPIRLSGGTVTPHLSDEAGKVDLNGADPKVLTNLFAKAGLDDASVAALLSQIVAMRGIRDTARSAPPLSLPLVSLTGVNLAPPAAAPAAPVPSRGRRRGFQSVDQLRDLAGVSPSLYRLLAPLLTVYNPDGKVNVLSANSDVLASLPGLTTSAVTEIIALRQATPAGVPNSVQPLLKDAARYAKTSYGPAYALRIDVVDRSGHTRSSQAVIAASKSLTDPYLLLSWQN